MKSINSDKRIKKIMRHQRHSKKMLANPKRIRLSVYKSNTHLFAQLIDDNKQITLAASSTLQLKLDKNNVSSATIVGTDIAKKALKLGIKQITFDKGGSTYHGKIKALADAARAEGLEF